MYDSILKTIFLHLLPPIEVLLAVVMDIFFLEVEKKKKDKSEIVKIIFNFGRSNLAIANT